MHLVDTHQHLWDLRRFPYSWTAGLKELNRTFLLEDYLAAADGLGITKTVFVECDVDPPHALEEARQIQMLADGHPLIAGIVASGRPELDGFRNHLEELARLRGVRGLRRVLHNQADDVPRSARFAENLRLLPEFGFTFDLCVQARQLPLAIRLVEQCPDVAFVLDHCGIPAIQAGALHPWSEDMARLAGFANVACKVSGLVAYAGADWSVDDLRPWFEHVIAHFGWERVLWGGDWPVCTLTGSLARWVDATRQLIHAASAEQRAALLHRNAERIYRV